MQPFPTRVRRCALVCATAILATPVLAQMAAFKNFRHYPTGQWQQELVGYRDNRAMGPPVTTTTCTGPLDPKAVPGIADAAKAAVRTCTTKVLTDQERLAESETVCKVGAGLQTVHVQMRSVDDRTILSETRSSLAGGIETVMKSKVTYLGACPAGAAAAPAKPSAADCAELAQMRQDDAAAGGAGQCARLPPQYRAQCEAGRKMIAVLEQQCK